VEVAAIFPRPIREIFWDWDEVNMPIGLKSNGLGLWDAPIVSSTLREEDITRWQREASSNDLASRFATIAAPAAAAL
jgi:hypothetical protein